MGQRCCSPAPGVCAKTLCGPWFFSPGAASLPRDTGGSHRSPLAKCRGYRRRGWPCQQGPFSATIGAGAVCLFAYAHCQDAFGVNSINIIELFPSLNSWTARSAGASPPGCFLSPWYGEVCFRSQVLFLRLEQKQQTPAQQLTETGTLPVLPALRQTKLAARFLRQ